MRYIGLYCFLLTAACFSCFAECPPPDPITNSGYPDSALGSEIQEDEFQNNVDSLVSSENNDIDTFAWNTQKINSGRFDWRDWNDTAKIALVDSATGKLFVHPFKNCVTSNFGSRNWLWHYGIDIRLKKGDSVHTAFNGIVRVIENDRHGYGNVVVVRHYNGLETIYGHLCKTLVSPNQVVKAGDIIGLGGNTGHSTGSHLHFETRYYGEAFDPNVIIDFENFTLKNDTLILTKDNFNYLSDLRKITWHVVKKGETLGRIARCYHTKISALCALNHLPKGKKLKIGSKIAVNTNNRSDELYTLRPKRQPKA
ncbi:MAG TPA: peptidase M23 [Fibrobacteres bacterium]|nr:peptidase M23 [Fibrobacterota bacterium]